MLQCCCFDGCDETFDTGFTVTGTPNEGCPRVYFPLGFDIHYIFEELWDVPGPGPEIPGQIEESINRILEYTGADDFSFCGSNTSIKFGISTSGPFAFIYLNAVSCGAASLPMIRHGDGNLSTFLCCPVEVGPGIFVDVPRSVTYAVCESPPTC